MIIDIISVFYIKSLKTYNNLKKKKINKKLTKKKKNINTNIRCNNKIFNYLIVL